MRTRPSLASTTETRATFGFERSIVTRERSGTYAAAGA
jgi:hypothetical protein